MTITLSSPRSGQKHNSLRAASLSLLTLVGLLAPSFARADVAVTVSKSQNSSEHAVVPAAPTGSNGSGGSSSGKGGGKSGGGSSKEEVTGSTFYTITARNTLDTPVKGVVIEYHFYNRTTASGSGGPTITVDDISDSVTIDLDGNGAKQIESKDIPHNMSSTSTSSQGKKGSPSTTSTTSSTQDVMGWVVYVEFKGKKVHTITSSDTILNDVAKYMPKTGN